ncbi:MAG: HEAT repeat domain-containing protein [Bdellovibrionia bacterium]
MGLSDRKLYLLAALLLVAAGAAIYLALKGPADGVAESLGDLEVLASGRGTPEQIYGAMIRQGEKLEELALKAALEHSESETPLLRDGSAKALGYFNDEAAFERLKAMVDDRDHSVRLAAISGLGRRQDSKRVDELKKLAARSDFDDRMRVAVYFNLYQADSSAEGKAETVSKLIEFGDGANAVVALEAVAALTTLEPEKPAVLDLLRRKVGAANQEGALAVSIRHLATREDTWIRQYLGRLSLYASPKVKIAVIQALHRVCPDDRWSIIEDFLGAEVPEEVLRTAIEELRFLGGS